MYPSRLIEANGQAPGRRRSADKAGCVPSKPKQLQRTAKKARDPHEPVFSQRLTKAFPALPD
ncbi:hypothetical protein DWY99_04130 [[Clostridium] leptum]|uniref:Uncharacterized protein n=1 Tax=[Clostridium] leptum TaxID=1535 RepID=A0A412AYQ5_9FIRM|nr:hypothetical protein DWY99_04130 [[Clostridium] leptum]